MFAAILALAIGSQPEWPAELKGSPSEFQLAGSVDSVPWLATPKFPDPIEERPTLPLTPPVTEQRSPQQSLPDVAPADQPRAILPATKIVPPSDRVIYEEPRPRADGSTGVFTSPYPNAGDIYDRVLHDLAGLPHDRQRDARYITQWPLPESKRAAVQQALLFWTASLSNRRQLPTLRYVRGLGWQIFLSDMGWEENDWELLVKGDPYFAVSVIDKQVQTRRGWINPLVEHNVRLVTRSAQAVVRADRFLGLTGTDVGSGGFYSVFLNLPNNEAELFKRKGVDIGFLEKNALLRGGAVLGGYSIVARHNRELQLLPTLVGNEGNAFLWRSLDTLEDVGEASVIENFLGTVRFAGKEYIGTNANGTHFYYLANAQNKQVGEVPTQIAQDHGGKYDATVVTPYKCVSCHGPKGGIREFDDAITQMAMTKGIGLAVITKNRFKGDQLREALEDYYLSPLSQDIKAQAASYTRVIASLNNMDPQSNAENFVAFVEDYLFGVVTKTDACHEFGVEPSEIDDYLKRSGNATLLAIIAGKHVPRKAFEAAFLDGMRARIHPWERSPSHAPAQAVSPPAVVKPPPVAAAVVQPTQQHVQSQPTFHRPPPTVRYPAFD